jgi:hypothetical protein
VEPERAGHGIKVACVATTLFGLAGIPAARTQAQDAASPSAGISFPDVPANHWAYQAVQDLADKGYVKGYPNGTFLGNRALTRYEFATVIERMLETVNDIKNSKTPTAAAPQVTQEDLNKIQVLVDTFKQQLTDIQANVTQAQKDIAELRGEVADLRQDVLDAKDLAAKAQKTADASYGFGSKRKFQISGYIQARYLSVGSGNKAEFPDGAAAEYNAFNGNYAKGGSGDTFALRRSRIKFTGQLTPNSKYVVQIDGGSGSSNSVTGKEGYVTYTFGDGSIKNPALTAGLFTNPFGYQVSISSNATLTPERPLVFNEGTATGGPFSGQDFERGVMLCYAPSTVKYTLALVNGTGTTGGTDVDRHVDQIYRVAYLAKNKVLGAGLSYYGGELGKPYTVSGATAFHDAKKELVDVDAQYVSPAGPFLQGEFISGKFEQRAYFASPAATALTTDYAPGNKIKGYYVQAGWTWGFETPHAFTAAASYDVFQRGASGTGSSSSYDDKNLGYGVLYNLDAQTRLRFWYVKPDKVAHLEGTAEPDKIGLFTSELQVKF